MIRDIITIIVEHPLAMGMMFGTFAFILSIAIWLAERDK